MSLIITIYSERAYQEFHLPALENADYSMVLDKHWFGISETVNVLLEVLDRRWKLKNGSGYRIDELQGTGKDGILKKQTTGKLRSDAGELLYVFVKENSIPFHCWEKFALQGIRNPITIGRNEGNTIMYDFGVRMVARNHAQIVLKPEGWTLYSYGDNATYVNNYQMQKNESRRLKFGDNINILGLHIVFLGQLIAINTDDSEVKIDRNILKKWTLQNVPSRAEEFQGKPASGKILYHRAPRNNEHLNQGIIEIENPPELENPPERPLFSVIGPAATMTLPMLLGYSLMLASSSRSGLYMYSGLVMSVSSALLGVFWAVSNMRAQKEELKIKKEQRFEAYKEYLLGKTKEIRNVYDSSIHILNQTYPDAATCVEYSAEGDVLWSRNSGHADFLVHRLGIGELPFQVDIKIPPEKFRLSRDELLEQPSEIQKNYRHLHDVPVTIDLAANKLIGVIGGKGKRGAYDILRILSAQVAANNCYTDVKLVYIYNGNSMLEEQMHSFAKWLPHVWSADKKIRYIVSEKDNCQDVFFELNNVFRSRMEEHAGFKIEKKAPNPYYIVFVSAPELLEGEILSKYLMDGSDALGVSTIFLCESYAELPNNCEYIIQNDSAFKGIYHVSDQQNERISLAFDQLDQGKLDAFAGRLTNLQVQEITSGGDIPSALTFFDMYHVRKPEELPVKELWAKNKIFENIRGLLGQKAGNRNCYLDVHEKYHGPHGLIAGTTGSGKSETLQTYIMSLALNYSPDDIGFFIIDYKGGGMANLFNGLPHMIGQISNLSGNQVRRAMISIKSENRRRQRVFTENGVNNINAYTKLYKSGEATLPVPHLFIIIDEFAELKREESDFMEELISVAQVGRSLGVHLILATQKPSGTVDDNIWSNSRFRLCLRVQDKQDSMDMLHKPDAAYITHAGRGYLQVGSDEVYEEFQSGYSGAIYEETLPDIEVDTVRLLNLDGTIALTGNKARVSLKNRVLFTWIYRLVKILEQVSQRDRISIPIDLNDSAEGGQLRKALYKTLADAEIEYPENKYNTDRMQDLIKLYSQGKKEDRADITYYIITEAEKQGIRLPQQKEKTQLDALKSYLAKVAKENGYTHEQLLWLPVLKEQLFLPELCEQTEMKSAKDIGHNWSIPITIGQFDDPANQNQPPFVLDLAACENLAVYGSVTSGKSTLLQTICYQLIFGYCPDVIQIYGIDFSNNKLQAFEAAPHVRGIYNEYDAERLQIIINEISEELEMRKQKLQGGSFSQYVQKNGLEFPAIVLLIDNFGNLTEKTENRFEKELIRLSREGINNGIYMVISGGGVGMNEIITRVADNLKTAICIQLKEKYAYTDLLHTMQIETLPEANVRGRGLAKYEERVLEFQTGLAVCNDNDYLRMEQIQKECEQLQISMGARFGISKTKKIPSNPMWEDLLQDVQMQEQIANPAILPVGYNLDTANIWGIPLKEGPCYSVCGQPSSGKTNFIKICIASVLLKKGKVVVIDSAEKPVLPEYRMDERLLYIDDAQKFFGFLQPGFISEFSRRNQEKRKIFAKEENWDKLFEILSKEDAYYLFIADFPAMIRYVEEAVATHANVERLPAIIESYMKAGKCHNIYFIAEITKESREKLLGDPIYSAFIRWNRGIHLGGNVAENVTLQFPYLSYKEKITAEKAGTGILSAEPNEILKVKKVVIPLYKR